MSSFKILAIVSAPVAIAKTGISLIHGYVACYNIGMLDTKDREEQAVKESKKKPE
jgi:CDP-diacylglycerol--inositol 3-phosphatidyltransferase